MISDLIITDLKIIPNPKGEIKHIIKTSDPGFKTFGEAYLSKVFHGDIKAWKKHFRMTSNLVCLEGEIRIVVLDLIEGNIAMSSFVEILLSHENYKRITIPPGLWYGFQGVGENNLLMNVADIIHDPNEQESCGVDTFDNIFKW